jgi:hypothetical protein
LCNTEEETLIQDESEPNSKEKTMTTSNITELYDQYIHPLPEADRLRLVELIAQKLATSTDTLPKQRSLLELEDVGVERWQGIEAQEYIRELRQE